MSSDTLESGQDGSIAQRIEQKLAECLDSARQAFVDQEFDAAFKALDQMPDSRRTGELRLLYQKCLNLKTAQELFDKGRSLVDLGDYEQAQETLQRIPEHSHTSPITNLIQKVERLNRSASFLRQAEDLLERHEYVRAQSVLEQIDEADRTDRFAALLQDAVAKQLLFEELLERSDVLWQEGETTASTSVYEKLAGFLQTLQDLKPDLPQTRSRREQVEHTLAQLRERDTLLKQAQGHFEAYEDDAAIELLRSVDERIRKGESLRLHDAAVARHQEVLRLTSEISDLFSLGELADVCKKSLTLNELIPRGPALLLERLGEEQSRDLLLQLADRSHELPHGDDLLDRCLCALPLSQLIRLIAADGDSLVRAAEESRQSLSARIPEMLDRLLEIPSEFEAVVQALSVLRTSAPSANEQCEPWLHLAEHLQSFTAALRTSWSGTAAVLESRTSRALDSSGLRLVEATERALPPDSDRWEWLSEALGAELLRNAGPVRLVGAKLEHHCRTGVWRSTPIVPLTKRRLIRATAYLAAVAAAGFTTNLLLETNVLAGYCLWASLGVLWVVAKRTIARIIE